ncbi:MAG: hypothetical protein ABI670_01240 [Chloroflexota bacterium]
MSRNYAETIADWYLRLNGFFTVQDFVLHPPESGLQNSSDTDILAVRFPDVSEKIGYVHPPDWTFLDDCDTDSFNEWDLALDKGVTAPIVQVKGGDTRADITEFSVERLLYAIKRVGLFAEVEWATIQQELVHRAVTFRVYQLLPAANAAEPITQRYAIGKLVISKVPTSHNGPWVHLSLASAEKFIYERFKTYKERKPYDWDKFPNELMQYMLWRVQRGLEE